MNGRDETSQRQHYNECEAELLLILVANVQQEAH